MGQREHSEPVPSAQLTDAGSAALAQTPDKGLVYEPLLHASASVDPKSTRLARS